MINGRTLGILLAGIVAAGPLVGQAAPAAAKGHSAAAPDSATPRVITVKMVGYTFQPAHVTVKPGDIVRYVQTTTMPHNVHFKDVPNGVNLGDVQQSKYLVTNGETFDLRIDGRFKPGTYNYVCTPHESLGMKGSIVVEQK